MIAPAAVAPPRAAVEPGARLAALLGREPAGAWMIATAFAAVLCFAVDRDLFLNDEGVLTWMFAGLTSEAPLDFLFFLKARPAISAVYAPVASFGFAPFSYAHVVVAALGIPLIAGLARAFGHRRPNVPAALLALSPLYFGSAAAGVQNSDAVVALLAAAWLLSRDAPLAAGIVSGLTVFGRSETLVFAVAFALFAASQPGRRSFLLGLAAVPLLYVPLGALYHGDLLWPLHFPPSLATNPAVDSRISAAYGGSLGDLAVSLVALTPAVGALLWLPWRGRPALERTLVLAALAFIAILRVLPLLGVINVDASPRYILPALPFLCLGVSSAIDTWGSARRARWRGLVLVAVAAGSWAVLDGFAAALFTAALLGCAAAAVLAARSTAAAVATVLATAAVLALPPLPQLRLLLGDQARVMDEINRWLRMVDLPPGTTLVTDYSLLRLWTERHAPDLQLDMRFLFPPDMRFEVETLSNPATRQREAFTGTQRFFYAPWLTEDQLAALPGEVYVVLRVENSRRNDLDRRPLRDVEWLYEGRWRGGPFRPGEVRAGRPDAAAESSTPPPDR